MTNTGKEEQNGQIMLILTSIIRLHINQSIKKHGNI